MTEKDVHYARSLGCLHDLSPTEWEKTLCDYQTISFGTGHQRRVRFSRRWCPEDQFPFGYMIISCVHALVSSFGSLTPQLWWSTNIGFSWTFTILGSSSQKHSICGSNQWFALMLLKKKKAKIHQLHQHIVSGLPEPSPLFRASPAPAACCFGCLLITSPIFPVPVPGPGPAWLFTAPPLPRHRLHSTCQSRRHFEIS